MAHERIQAIEADQTVDTHVKRLLGKAGGRLIFVVSLFSLFAVATSGAAETVAGRWMRTNPAPEGRGSHVSVWTGSRMIVWGGAGETGFPTTGFLYDPAGDAWTEMSSPSELQPCKECKAVWTGSRMIVWGRTWDWVSSVGQVYDPATDTWSLASANGAPTARRGHTAVWAGSRMIVWGGYPDTATGGTYDPAADAWTATSVIGAPSARSEHTAVWTGSKMIVWGGLSRDAWNSAILTNTGAVYDPATDTWTPMSTNGAPSARHRHTVVWTGSRMIVWGGDQGGGQLTNTGAIYDPRTDSWTPLSTEGAPTARDSHTAVWTGSQMIVWGGGQAAAAVARDASDDPATDTGASYDPVTDSWSPISRNDAPTVRNLPTAVWTGSSMIVWGGTDARGEPLATGGGYAPGGSVRGDLDGDGQADILWHHQSTGQLYAWLMDGAIQSSGTFLTPAGVNPVWQVRGIGDFDGDGKNDILWHNQSTGQLHVWLMNGTTPSSGVLLTPSSVNPIWQVQGLADLNGDGKPDILWRHQTTGQLYAWIMDGTTSKSGAFLTPAAVASTAWQIRGLADFNGDGKADILWHNTASGQLYVWFMNGTVQSSGAFLTPARVADTSWRVAQVADFNGDGKAEILWRNQSTGQLYVWLMNGTMQSSGMFLTPATVADLSWQIVPQ